MDLKPEEEEKISQELFGKRPDPVARFYVHAVLDRKKSIESEMPIFHDAVYVLIRVPDSKDCISKRATDEHKARFPEQWAHFEAARGRSFHPVELLPDVTPSVCASLKGMGIVSVEQLAEYTGKLPDYCEPFVGVAKRLIQFMRKPRMRLVNGEFKEVA